MRTVGPWLRTRADGSRPKGIAWRRMCAGVCVRVCVGGIGLTLALLARAVCWLLFSGLNTVPHPRPKLPSAKASKRESKRASELLRYALDKASLLFVLALVGHRVELGLSRDQPERPDHRSEFTHIDNVLPIGVEHPECRCSAQMNRKSRHRRACSRGIATGRAKAGEGEGGKGRREPFVRKVEKRERKGCSAAQGETKTLTAVVVGERCDL